MLDYAPAMTTQQAAPSSGMGLPAPGSGLPASVIDGTPVRVAVIVLCCGAGVVGLRWMGIKFSSTVSVS